MPSYSEKSKKRLESCHPSLQNVFNEVIKYIDIAILCGHRGEKEQNEAYNSGKSKKKWPESKHNKISSLAVDVAPYPIDWYDLESFYFLGGFVIALAESMGIKIVWGGDWNRNFKFGDQNFNDLPHFELILDE